MHTPPPAARSFRDLLVWRKAHEFVLAVYKFTAAFPRQKAYGLALQMRRAAVSVTQQRLRHRHSAFCLLTPAFHVPKGHQGRRPWLVKSVSQRSLRQDPVNKLNHDRSLADRRGHTFHASRAHIADSEDPGHAGLEKVRLPA
jgi:23S rRNA-intervening sequence protein